MMTVKSFLIPMVCFAALAAVAADDQHLRRHRPAAPKLKIAGNNGAPFGGFPLGMCEGDCDHDSECEPGLFCFQRDSYQAVPGCSGGERIRSKADYCTAILDISVDESFYLKLYWEQNYYWQEETFERKWCLTCRRTDCVADIEMMIVNCDESTVNYFNFVKQGGHDDEVVIQLAEYPDLCWARVNDLAVRTQTCDFASVAQRWRAQPGSFDDARFEITPVDDSSLCVTQRHHPKADEVIKLEPCTTARKSDTSFWNKYNIRSG